MTASVATIRAHLADTIGEQAPPPPRLNPITAADLLAMDLPARELILAPWLPVQGLAMVYAPRGVGKTHLSLGAAYAVATGGPFLRWNAPTPRKVLLIDGEMPAITLKGRLATIVDQTSAEPPSADYLRLLANDLHPDGIPDLSTEEGQSALLEVVADADLIVMDNLSTLCRSGKENEADSWGAVQGFLLRLRREGRSVLLIHHAGKNGAQRGTSRREDVLDTVINLSRPADYKPTEGARFIVSFEKSRGFTGEEAEPFEATLNRDSGVWETRNIEDVRDARIIELSAEGLSGTEIAEELDVNKSTISRAMKRLRSTGMMS